MYPDLLEKIEFRNEKKVIFTQKENYLINFFKFLKFREIHQKRRINSIYFETPDLKDLKDTIDGEKNRSKLRLRWYGNTFNNFAECVLENKIKVNNKNYKIRHNLGKIEFKNIISTHQISKILKNLKKIDDKFKIQYKIRNPNLLISYERRYFMYKNIRITLDINLKSKDFYKKKKILENEFFFKQKYSIVEMKFQDEDYKDILSITKYFKSRVSKFSKYENALVSN